MQIRMFEVFSAFRTHFVFTTPRFISYNFQTGFLKTIMGAEKKPTKMSASKLDELNAKVSCNFTWPKTCSEYRSYSFGP